MIMLSILCTYRPAHYMGAYYFKGFQIIHGYVVGPKYSEYCKDMSLGKRTILCVASMNTNRIHLTILHTNK